MNQSKGKSVELSDAKARQQALDPNNSYIVSAPAGSGKCNTKNFFRIINST